MLAVFVWLEEPAPLACVAVLWVEEPEDDEFEDFDDELLCVGAGGLAGAEEAPLAGLFADDPPPLVCRRLEKLVDGAFEDVELAGGAELAAVIISRIASVMNQAAVRERYCPARPQQRRGHSGRTT